MIELLYRLHAADGDFDPVEVHVEVHSAHVPRVGEMVSFDFDRSYEVVDVFWQISDGELAKVAITACERDWHYHIANVVEAYEQRASGA